MKNIVEQIKGLNAWYVAASALGRDRATPAVRERVATRPPLGSPFFVARRPTSGLMTLRAVHEGERDTGAIVDFEWAYASKLAARLLDRDPSQLLGHRLLQVLTEQREGIALFEHYRSVIEEGTRDPIQHEHMVDGSQRVLRHSALRLGGGVLVTLTDMSTGREHDAPRLQWVRLDDSAFPSLNFVQAGK